MKIIKKDIMFELCIIFIMIFYTLNGAKAFSGNMRIAAYIGICFGIGKFLISIRNFIPRKATITEIKVNMILVLMGGIVLFLYLRVGGGGDTRMLIALLTLICAIDIRPEKIICVMFYAKLLTFVLAILTGGYDHINGAALHGGMVIMLYICMKNNLRQRDYAGLIVAYLALALYTKSGSAILGIGIGILFTFLSKLRVGKAFLGSCFIVYIYPICLFLNIFLSLGIYEEKMLWIGGVLPNAVNRAYIYIVKMIDTYTSSRLQLGHASLEKFGVSWLGGNIDYSILWPGIYFNLDSGMLWLLQGGGILITVVFMVLTIFLMKYFIDQERYHYVIAAFVVALWAMQEDMLTAVGTNFLIVFMGHAIRYSVERSKHGYTKGNSLLLVRKREVSGESG